MRLTNSEISKLYDRNAVCQVIGSLMQDPTLLKNHPLTEKDFEVDAFHALVFGIIQNQARDNSLALKPEDIKEYIGGRDVSPTSYTKFMANKGDAFLKTAYDYSNVKNFDFNYNTVRKWSLLRQFAKEGFDISDYYDPYEEIPDIIQAKRDKFNSSTIVDIIKEFRVKLLTIDSIYNIIGERESLKAGGQSALDQIEAWRKERDFGFSYTSNYLTTMTYGMRKGRYSIYSAGSGVGKTRFTLANMCYAFAPKYWDEHTHEWKDNPHGHGSALYIGTEQELEKEIVPIIEAYMANVPVEHILQGNYTNVPYGEKVVDKNGVVVGEGNGDEYTRVKEAAQFLHSHENSGIYLEYIPDFTVEIIENLVEQYYVRYGISALYFDYIWSCPALTMEFSKITGDKGANRDDLVLAHLSSRLKAIARKYNIAVETCTQVNAYYREKKYEDNEQLVRGGKSIIDKCDTASILRKIDKTQVESVKRICKSKNFIGKFYFKEDPETHEELGPFLPNGKEALTLSISTYKNRGGKYNMIKTFLYIDFDTMRVHDLFTTNYNYEIAPIEKSCVYVDSDNKVQVCYNGEELESRMKEGLISKKQFDQIVEENDLNNTPIAKDGREKKILEQAKKDVEINSTTVSEEYDDLDFDY